MLAVDANEAQKPTLEQYRGGSSGYEMGMSYDHNCLGFMIWPWVVATTAGPGSKIHDLHHPIREGSITCCHAQGADCILPQTS